LCDEAGIFRRQDAVELLAKGVERGLISEAKRSSGFPNQIWVVDSMGQVFEAMQGGHRDECYHGYPIRRSDPFFDEVSEIWMSKDHED
jgi:hypothetical protein